MPSYRIIVDLSDRNLYLLDGNIVVRSYPVGIGKMVTKTPSGEFTIINKQENPGGPYGALWMGLSKPHYGIHGTNDPSSIGRHVSHGCIRMYNDDVIALSQLVPIRTRVTIRPRSCRFAPPILGRQVSCRLRPAYATISKSDGGIDYDFYSKSI